MTNPIIAKKIIRQETLSQNAALPVEAIRLGYFSNPKEPISEPSIPSLIDFIVTSTGFVFDLASPIQFFVAQEIARIASPTTNGMRHQGSSSQSMESANSLHLNRAHAPRRARMPQATATKIPINHNV